ncbi:CopD family protein [Spirosoma linguale]|uniref:Protoporphyrinogen IX oxidase n=1 Tax=Spirosoma linguale (strain ATCC 33905 / DSM 74 / LMG 10896 / Claus 1) TaxID=504472 RepID=D2QQE6_SPILD|nr:conserved hypothetical protein [Spirosoma linguale DSM 74]
MTFFYLKALHIIFVVTWFAGLFYIPRLFIYFTEAADQPEPARQILQSQFAIMQRRLWYGITWPSALITLALGLSTWYNYGATPPWLVVKLAFVGSLYAYHLACHVLFRQQQRGELRYTSTQLRIWNEVATLLLFSIVFLVVLKDVLSLAWGMLGLVLFMGLLLAGIWVYKRLRER